MNRDQRRRYLQVIQGNDFSEDELREMWVDQRGDQQVPDLSIEQIEQHIFSSDIELWKAKRRASDGRLTAVIDGIDICQEHALPLPFWLVRASCESLALLAGPTNTSRALPFRGRLSSEVTLLKELQQAKLMHRILRGRALNANYPEQRMTWIDVSYPDHVVSSAEEHSVDLEPKKMSQSKAAEIVELWLTETWAEGKHGSIIQAYKKARKSLLTDLSCSHLTEMQENFLAHDLEQVRPNTREAIGCPIIN